MKIDNGVEKIDADGKILAIVIRSTFSKQGCSFVTPEDFPFQLGIHVNKAGTHVKAHSHLPFKELKNIYPQESFYVESGKIEVGIYKNSSKYSKVVLNKGDMILLNCPHEVVFLEDSKFIELKQGPYRGKDAEKKFF